MTKRLSRQGLILTVSIAAIAPSPLNVTYHASKTMLHSLALAIGEELREKQVTNVDYMLVCPGLTTTNLNNGLFKRFIYPRYLGLAWPATNLVTAALRDFSYEKLTYGPIGHDVTALIYHVLQNNTPTLFAYICRWIWEFVQYCTGDT